VVLDKRIDITNSKVGIIEREFDNF
jgi:hypothetical protein